MLLRLAFARHGRARGQGRGPCRPRAGGQAAGRLPGGSDRGLRPSVCRPADPRTSSATGNPPPNPRGSSRFLGFGSMLAGTLDVRGFGQCAFCAGPPRRGTRAERPNRHCRVVARAPARDDARVTGPVPDDLRRGNADGPHFWGRCGGRSGGGLGRRLALRERGGSCGETDALGFGNHDRDEGHVVSAPEGAFRANGYGLHQRLGNVWEWTCSAWARDYDGSRTRCGGALGCLAGLLRWQLVR